MAVFIAPNTCNYLEIAQMIQLSIHKYIKFEWMTDRNEFCMIVKNAANLTKQ